MPTETSLPVTTTGRIHSRQLFAATGKAPSNDNESAILGLLAPGNYTAIVAGKNGTKGVALIEFYNLP